METTVTSLFAWPVIFSLASGVGSLLLVWKLWRIRDRPAVRWFLVTLSGQTLFCFIYASSLLVTDPSLRYTLEVAGLVFLNWLGVPFLGFALEYTGRSRLVTSWYYRAQFVFPLLATVLLPLNRSHELFWTDFQTESVLGVVGATYTTEPLLFVTVIGGTSGAALGSLLLLDTFLSYGPLYRREAIAVGLSPLVPSVGIFMWLFQIGPVPALNLTAALFLPHVLLDAYAFAWSDMFEFHPATKRAAERSALDDIGSPVIVVDEQGRIVELNPQADTLVSNDDDAVTRPVEDVIGAAISLDQNQRFTLQQDGQRRNFRVRPAPLTDSGDNHVGYTLVFQDITTEVRREQRLQVLNRVLRHNLRNDMTVVEGYLGIARSRTDDERLTDPLGSAQNKTETLIATSEKARNVAAMIQTATDQTSDVNVGRVCRDIAETYRTTNSASITVDADDDTCIETNLDLLTTVLENIVENAVCHGGETPVTVTVDRHGDTTCVAVHDDGPGIPQSELATIRSGEETDLQHGSGFGLWVIKWGTERLGGEVTFETGDGGTTATVCLPDQNGPGE